MGFWPPLRGEGYNQLERFTLNALTATYTDRGRLYGSLTSSEVRLYSDVDRTNLVAVGDHAQPSTWTKVELFSNEGTPSGINGSCYLRYVTPSSSWEVWPILTTDTELKAERIDIERYPHTDAASTFLVQHIRTREDFVRLMLTRLPPVPNRERAVTGTQRGDIATPWRVNSIGDYELVRLQNVESYRQWAIHHCLAMIFKTVNRVVPNEETQLQVIEEETALASAAWSETIPLLDFDDDKDADAEAPRFKVSRG